MGTAMQIMQGFGASLGKGIVVGVRTDGGWRALARAFLAYWPSVSPKCGFKPVLANHCTSKVLPIGRKAGAVSKDKKSGRPRKGVGRTHSEKPTELLSKRKFRERFSIPNGLAIRLMNGGPVPTEKEPFNATVFKVLFIYTVKMSLKRIFTLFAHIPSRQLVTRLPDSTKGATKGHAVVLGP
ncbi:hypothetical protein CK203_047831 [Vitis vinifera]|uniref:Uncharacterized protein n=1 Tax=Vitis vinifera TaxID=29760 RepID=A0A438H8U2_VITVI|nr:hypothetical protein CK203_047831 [Vitis vinifera]